MTLGATFDGEPIVASKTIPIAADIWRGEYATTAEGGCEIAPIARSRCFKPGSRSHPRGPMHAPVSFGASPR